MASGIDGLAQLREGGILNWLMDGYLNEREKTARLLEVESRFFLPPKAAETPDAAETLFFSKTPIFPGVNASST